MISTLFFICLFITYYGLRFNPFFAGCENNVIFAVEIECKSAIAEVTAE